MYWPTSVVTAIPSPCACMNEIESNEMKAWLAAIGASPMRATRVRKIANDAISSHH